MTYDGQVYEVEASEKGEELTKLVFNRVKVVGMVGEYAGMKIIYIISYKII